MKKGLKGNGTLERPEHIEMSLVSNDFSGDVNTLQTQHTKINFTGGANRGIMQADSEQTGDRP